ncbi:N-acetyltransferase [Flavobacterium sediminis]|uniref:N-acetyltransferase n=2 Tax=Flavobacterium sediminis TaxID=2201181 RepID=A0A2U8QW19_9FLAO|nr:N-acetyltransferase [Flavobacterium sediminis]
MEIRLAQKGDLPQIVGLCKQHAEYEQAEYSTKDKEKLLSKAIFGTSPSLKCLVVAEGNTIVGYATFMQQFSTWDVGFYLYLDCLFLTEETRGKGLGTALMEKIKEYSKIENCTEIQWQTPDFNEKAIRFYQKNGGISKKKERFFMKV